MTPSEAHLVPPPPHPTLWTRIANVTSLVATPLRPSHYLELLNPLWASHALRARVEDVWDETRDARTLTLRPGRGWRAHRAGQYVRVGVVIDGMRHTRTYSISSSPDVGDGCFAITVKAIAGGRVSRHLVRNVRRGDHLSIGLPQGDFVLREATPVRPLFLTAGSGITPVMSMLRTFHTRGAMPDTVHVHWAPHVHDVIFAPELDRLVADEPRYRLHQIHTRGAGEQTSHDRHFTPTLLDDVCPDWRQREVWACGPQTLLDAVEAHWRGAGLGRHVHVERFHAARAELAADATGGRVRFAASNRETEADARMPLLRVAEDAGLNPAHGCRMGICHTCDVRLLAGCVRDLRTGALVAESGRTVQLCVTAAAGDVALEL